MEGGEALGGGRRRVRLLRPEAEVLTHGQVPLTSQASLLAGGISKALINTAAGLAVALPSLAMHHYLRHRLVTSGLALEEQLDRVLDACVRPGSR